MSSRLRKTSVSSTHCPKGKVRNPYTNRCIKIGGPTYTKLNLNDGKNYTKRRKSNSKSKTTSVPRTVKASLRIPARKPNNQSIKQHNPQSGLDFDFRGIAPSRVDNWSDTFSTITDRDIKVLSAQDGKIYSIPAGSQIYLTELEQDVILGQPSNNRTKTIPFTEFKEIDFD